MGIWLLVYHLTWDAGFSWEKHPGVEYGSKEDCMEQVEVMRQNAKENGMKIRTLYCKPAQSTVSPR